MYGNSSPQAATAPAPPERGADQAVDRPGVVEVLAEADE